MAIKSTSSAEVLETSASVNERYQQKEAYCKQFGVNAGLPIIVYTKCLYERISTKYSTADKSSKVMLRPFGITLKLSKLTR